MNAHFTHVRSLRHFASPARARPACSRIARVRSSRTPMNIWAMMPGWLLRAVQVSAGLCTVGLGALYFFQEKLLYLPVPPGMSAEYPYLPDRFNLKYEDVWLDAADGTKLHCWHILGKLDQGKQPVMLFFQENAGNMAYRLPFIAEVVRRLGCAVFVLGYRGYGKSAGSPNQPGLEMDAEAALEYVLTRDDIDPARIVLIGKSLGGAVTLHIAAKHRDTIRAAIIENTFTSVEHMVPSIFPFLGVVIGEQRPLNFLVTNKWQNFQRVQEIGDMPLMMIASVHDELVPYKHMQRLNELKSTTRFRWIECPNSGHMDAYERDRRQYWPALDEFWETFVL